MKGVAMLEERPARKRPRSPMIRAELPSTGSRDWENTTGLLMTVPVPNSTVPAVMMMARVIRTPRMTLKRVSNLASSKPSSPRYFSWQPMEW